MEGRCSGPRRREERPLCSTRGSHPPRRVRRDALCCQADPHRPFQQGGVRPHRPQQGRTPARQFHPGTDGREDRGRRRLHRQKVHPGRDYARLETLLSREGVPTVPENDLLRMGDLSWESYRKVLQLAEDAAPGGSIAFHGTWPDGEPELLDIPADLLEETLRCDAQGFIGGLGKIPVVRIATEKNPVLPRFITAGACKITYCII